MVQGKGFKGIGRSIKADVQTNATHLFLHVSTFHSHGNDGFPMSTAPSGAGFRAADEKFVGLDTPGEFSTSLANGAASELLPPAPGCLIAAKAQELLKSKDG